LNVTAHVTKNETGRRSNLDLRTTRHAGYAINLIRRWLVEKGLDGSSRPARFARSSCGLHNVSWLFVFSCAAHQPDAAAQADRPESRARPQGEVRLKLDWRAQMPSLEPPTSA
jgi:hypothetical protein